MSQSFIPVNEPWLGQREKELLNECIDTGWISSEGPFVSRFEKDFSAKMGRAQGVAVCNGSVAIDVALAALGVGAGDEVILPSFTIISCAAAVIRVGATPVVVDSDPITWNMDVSQIEKKITAKTKAIMVVHIYGLTVDMDPLMALARKHDLKVVEDAAEVHGQFYKDKPCGSFGDISTFSFYPNKHITTGEGGMIVMNDKALADKCRSLRNLCFVAERRFVHEELGWNYRMSNLQAALGIAQLERLDDAVKKKRAIGEAYNSRLKNLKGIETHQVKTEYCENIYWVYGLVLKDDVGFDAAEAMKRLAKLGIGTRPFFWPMHEQPVFKKMGLFKNEKHPVAERLARRGFYLPSGLALTDDQIDRASEALIAVMSGS